MKTALITGITGQDGSYLADYLLKMGYHVVGLVRRSSNIERPRIDHLRGNPRVTLEYGDVTDAHSLAKLFHTYSFDEIYHLASQSHVSVSFDMPNFTADVILGGTLNLLEALHQHARSTHLVPRFYNASSSEMFGNAIDEFGPLNEASKFDPISPYAIAKVAAHNMAKMYRSAYGMFICNGILFNHESPRRGETFVTRKITMAVAEIKAGKREKLKLGNLKAERDWGFAGDYVIGMHQMLQQPHPDDYVLATGNAYSVTDFLVEAFGLVGLKYEDHVEVDARYVRPTEINTLVGDSAKARKELGWHPKVHFRDLVAMMVESDMARQTGYKRSGT